jgi:hypothetical protein
MYKILESLKLISNGCNTLLNILMLKNTKGSDNSKLFVELLACCCIVIVNFRKP